MMLLRPRLGYSLATGSGAQESDECGLRASDCVALLLNADMQPLSYLPLSLVSWKDAVKAVFQGKAVVLASYDRLVRSPSVELRAPSVIALREMAHRPRVRAKPTLTKRVVLLRDELQCLYCGKRCAPRELTLDHVVPRSAGGGFTWTNVATCCVACNRRKGQLQPHELGRVKMKLQKKPHEPTRMELQQKARRLTPFQERPDWAPYISNFA